MKIKEIILESVMMTEEEFDEAAGEKDACYHKVKSRYKVGAKNWGNKSKKK